MDYYYVKKVEMQVVLIVCNLIVKSLGVSLFGIDLPAPDKSVNTGFERLSQSFVPIDNGQKTNDTFGAPFKDNFYRRNVFNPTPIDFVENVKLKPALPVQFINELIPDDQKASTDTPVKLKNHGFFNSKEEPSKSTESTNEKSKEMSTSYTLSEIGTDYTTETSEYETTTDDEFSHVGGPAPAVVASLLG